MDIRGTKLLRRLHEWLAREPVYKLMREDRDTLSKDMRVIADAICGKPDARPGELLLKISDLKAEAAFRRDAEAWRALNTVKMADRVSPPRRMVRNPEATCGNCPYCDKGGATEGRDSCALTQARLVTYLRNWCGNHPDFWMEDKA